MLDDFVYEGKDSALAVERKQTDSGLQLTFKVKSAKDCVLHWGVTDRKSGSWQAPPESIQPLGTQKFSPSAARTPFQSNQGEQRLVLNVSSDIRAPFLAFVLWFPDSNRWENNRGKDYFLPLIKTQPESLPVETKPAPSLKQKTHGCDLLFEQKISLGDGCVMELAVSKTQDHTKAYFLTDLRPPLLLHWGLANGRHSAWKQPPPELLPPKSAASGDQAVQTPFENQFDGRYLCLEFPESAMPKGIVFVLYQPTENRWIKVNGRDFFMPIQPAPDGSQLSGLQQSLVDAEMGDHGWTLMHRFNLCHDLADAVRQDRAGWVVLFVWMRYSALRQLDWQRNYNTKPRELSHAQDRLSARLAQAWIEAVESRDLIRFMLASMGRGGEGQRIRDEILQIMHRHHIKEVGGTWMEQWHQKLHNNTTPDDIVICEAYLAFLRENGNKEKYFEVLDQAGVTRERLASLERPINTEPEWHPHLKEGLIHDFQHYLALLKSVHSGTDLDTAATRGGYLLHDAGKLWDIKNRCHDPHADPVSVAHDITSLRRELTGRLNRDPNASCVRDGLYLDLAVEETLRLLMEKSVHADQSGSTLRRLLGLILENLLLTKPDEELSQCLEEWQNLPEDPSFQKDWALHAKAILDRISRALAQQIDRLYAEVQPRAVELGRAFQAEPWSVELFSETVVRGQPAFSASLIIRHLDPILRRSAHLGNWQIISPCNTIGKIVRLDSLRQIQGKEYDQPTVVLADKVYGDEEPPKGVCAVITPSSVDLVSHVAVRTRNIPILFATCYDPKMMEELRRLEGRTLEWVVDPNGDLRFKEVDATSAPYATEGDRRKPRPSRPAKVRQSIKPIGMRAFHKDYLGGKSSNLRVLAEHLPDWIRLPKSVALPFGVFEFVLGLPENQQIEERHRTGLAAAASNPETQLKQVRKNLHGLRIPEALMKELRESMQTEGLEVEGDQSLIEQRIKEVWASKWTERAWHSRRSLNWPDNEVFMAVLIQEVIPSDYAFVIHTANPFTGDKEELYAEVVLGLGETLVGNYPGRAMGFVSGKSNPDPKVLAYPGKSVGLYGSGLIFRSDSNAEDLLGFAGAGLYESVLLQPPQEVKLNYTREPLVWDAEYRRRILTEITRIGKAIEDAYGTPQDVEGVISKDRFYVVQTRPQVGLKQ